jgi:hypothetical protein
MPDEIAERQEAEAPAEVIAASASAGPDAVAAGLSTVGSNPVDPAVEVEHFAVAVSATRNFTSYSGRPRLIW